MKPLIDTTLAVDPGWVRLENSLKGTAAIVTAMVFSALLIFASMPQPSPQPVVYSFYVGYGRLVCDRLIG